MYVCVGKSRPTLDMFRSRYSFVKAKRSNESKVMQSSAKRCKTMQGLQAAITLDIMWIGATLVWSRRWQTRTASTNKAIFYVCLFCVCICVIQRLGNHAVSKNWFGDAKHVVNINILVDQNSPPLLAHAHSVTILLKSRYVRGPCHCSQS